MGELHAQVQREQIRSFVESSFQAKVPIALSWPAMQQLISELGDLKAVMDWLIARVEASGKPAAFAIPLQGQGIRSAWLFPKSWGDERRDGYAAGLWEEIASSIGPYAESQQD
jgi:hypothetical protein